MKNEIQIVKISELKQNENNPRFIKDDKFKKLCQSIKEFPEMLSIRPIIADENNIVLGGNMRLKACLELKLKEVPVIFVNILSEAQKAEFIIKDNVGFGEWDWDKLSSEWDAELLNDWGLDLPVFAQEKDIEIPKQFDDSAEKYLNNTVRQIMLVFDVETHKVVLEKMEKIGLKYNIVDDNSAVVLKLLEYEKC